MGATKQLSIITTRTILDMSRRQVSGGGFAVDLAARAVKVSMGWHWGWQVQGLVLPLAQLGAEASHGRIIYALLCLSPVIYQNKE